MKRQFFPRKFFAATLISLVAIVITAIGQTPDDPATEFYRLTKAAPAAFNSGEYAKAEALSFNLLKEAESWKTNWNYGNAIHAANLVLGRVALVQGDIDEARKFLIAAGKTPGSPQLNSFGPDMLFAHEMLKRGESKVVLEYFELCAKFWLKKHSARLEDWRKAVSNNEPPEFGANLRHIF